jgi:hypothetical protein
LDSLDRNEQIFVREIQSFVINFCPGLRLHCPFKDIKNYPKQFVVIKSRKRLLVTWKNSRNRLNNWRFSPSSGAAKHVRVVTEVGLNTALVGIAQTTAAA